MKNISKVLLVLGFTAVTLGAQAQEQTLNYSVINQLMKDHHSELFNEFVDQQKASLLADIAELVKVDIQSQPEPVNVSLSSMSQEETTDLIIAQQLPL